MSKRVLTTPLADLHILALDAWWRENREKAPDLFEQELSLAFRTLSSAPSAGRRYRHASTDVRRIVLRASRNHVYYIEHEDHVLVVAVWGGIKHGGPDLSGL
ncbi:MAG: type II toxin-antitoxin system RelE/ParE family toxin [Sandaracinaceae bacterium]|nr:type II toxin-antitoxin system RelE/ParE family toxin [Sandaracinaceae bacterium]